MKPKMKKALKRAAIITTGVFAFAGTFIGGYMVTPNRTKYIDVSVDTPEPTAFGQFVSRITKDIGLEEDDTAPKYLHAEFDNFEMTYKMSSDATFTNHIGLDGNIDFRMSALSISGVEFNVDAVADYNGKQLPLTLGRFHDDLYFGLKDMKLKMTDFKGDKIVDEYWYAFAVYANMDLPKFMRGIGNFVDEQVTPLIDGLINGSAAEEEPSNEKGIEDVDAGGFDFSSLLSSGPKEEHIGNEWRFTLGEEDGDFCIKITTDEDFVLKYVDLGTIAFGDITISGGISIDLKDYEDFVSPASGNDYVEVFNYTGLTNKLFSILKEDGQHQRFGFEFALDLDNIEKKNQPIDIARIEGSVNVNFDELLDLSQYEIEAEPDDSEKEELTLEQAINKVGFNLQVDLIGQNDIEYANFDLGFAEGSGYVRFNEQEDSNNVKKSVMKLKMDTETTNRIVDMIPDMIEETSGEESTDSLETLKSFLTDELIESVDKGDFSFILDILETLESDADGIRVGLNLSSLGIGENARVDINLKNDSRLENINDVIASLPTYEERVDAYDAYQALGNVSEFAISASNISFGDFVANIDANTAPFADLELGNKGDYQSVKFIPDVIDQVSDFIQTKKTGFSVTGSMKDSAGLGTDFYGEGQLDNNDEVKRGYGTMHIDQYKYHANSVWATHDMAVDIANVGSDIIKTYDEDGALLTRQNNNLALFVYGNPNAANIKGKLRLQTFTDILDIITTFTGEYGNDPKFTKFLGPIIELMGFGALGDIINSKDYVKLASNELLQEVSVINNGGGLRIVISKIMLGLPDDITIELAFNGDNDSGNQTLKSLDVVNFAMGTGADAKMLNFHFQLEDYDENYQSVINRANVANEKYMNLDGIKVLLDLGINTTKPNYWHLSANAHVDALIINIDLKNIDFYVYVDGEKAKVYGKFGSIPVSGLYTQDVTSNLLDKKSMEAEFTFETFNDEDHNGVAGMFNISRTLKTEDSRLTGSFLNWHREYFYDCKTYHYRSESGNFLDNIARYLLGGVIGIKSSYLDSDLLGGSSSSSSETAAGDFTNTFTSTGFNCGREIYEGVEATVIRTGLNLNELTGIDALREVEATIVSKEVTYTHNDKQLTMDILGKLVASLRVHFIADINVSFTATVEDAELDTDLALSKWNTNGQSRLTALSGNINGKAISATSNSSYFNNANNPYTYSWEQPR